MGPLVQWASQGHRSWKDKEIKKIALEQVFGLVIRVPPLEGGQWTAKRVTKVTTSLLVNL